MTDRPIDPSTGRPSDKRDHEVRDELRERHAGAWRKRDGEIVKRLLLRSGLTALGRVWDRGEVIEVTVGDDDWVETCDPNTGESFLDLTVEDQIARWGRRMFAEVNGEIATEDLPSPFDDDRPHRPSATRMPKGEAAAYAAMRAAWAEQEALADEPVRQVSAETRRPKGL